MEIKGKEVIDTNNPNAVTAAIEIAKIAVGNSTNFYPCKDSAENIAEFIEILSDRLKKVDNQLR